MRSLAKFPDAEDVALELFEELASTVTETDDPIRPPVIRVNRVGGNTTQLQDFPRIEVACYAADRSSAWELAREAERLGHSTRGRRISGVLVDRIKTDNPPTQPPYDNPNIRRVTLYLRFTWRRPEGG